MADENDDATTRGFDVGFEGHRRRQMIAGLALTHAQRLQWLEDTLAEMRRLLGRVRRGPRPPAAQAD